MSPPVPAGETDRIPRVFLAAGDLAALAVAFVAAQRLASGVQGLFLTDGILRWIPEVLPVPEMPRPELFPGLGEIAWLYLVTAPVTLLVLELSGGYRRLLGLSARKLLALPVLSQTVAISFSALIVFALKLTTSSRVLIFTYALFSAVALIAFRASAWSYQRRRRAQGAYTRNVLLVGQPDSVTRMIDHFTGHVAGTEFRLIGWLDAGDADALPDAAAVPGGLPRLGRAGDVGELLVHHPIHEVIAIQPATHGEWMRTVVEHCDYFRTRLRVVPEVLIEGTRRDLQLAYRADPLRLPDVVLAPVNLDADSLFVKRLIDIAVSSALLLLLSPLFLLIALAIRITTPRLPVLFPWRVIGLNGRPFTGYKFTTMVADAEAQKDGLRALNEMQGPVFKIKDDPRVTPLGRMLRRFSLNELPQLWSVLKGDMSLVGPRPAFRDELERYELWQKRKLSVKPGMTCLWQVSGRNRINDFNDWVRLDLEYIERWSLWLDMRILARTAWAVVSGTGS